ncbi:hypothetical protein [Kurthia sibirica]|uniref:Fimbrial assembly protein n=1 Tax=Kurthia sibirica TaxID=202750 RepID=A0A2U3AII2_9BACL|nr:hypothetical protein [Kurthia sibirica]PWI24317.1 hypothetical protein DEX24_13925 [Kurthia sibirica]GEK34397.1 hypothetical protein KSI01_19300 [Kurthia sibirica]
MLPNINLLPKEQDTKKKNLGKLIVYLLILAIIVFYGINYFLVNRDVREEERKTDVLSTQIADLQKDIAAINNTPQGVLGNSINFALTEKIDLSKVIDVAMKNTAGSAEFAGISYKNNRAEFIVYFDALNDATAYIKKLSGNELFKTVTLTSASAFTDITIDNVDKEQDLEGTSRYKAVIAVTLDKKKLQSGGGK